MATDRSFGRENRLVVVWARLCECTQWTHYRSVSFLFRSLSGLFCRIFSEWRKIKIKHTFSCLLLSTLLIFSSSYCLSFPYHPHLLFIPSLPSPLAFFLSPPFISCYRYCSLSFFIIALALSFFTSLSKEPDVFLVWFIQMQRLGLRECAAGTMHSASVQMVEYTSYCHSLCKWVFHIYMNQAFYFLFFFYWNSCIIIVDMT